MKTAIFLGAGASAAEGAPVQSKLFHEYFKSIHKKKYHTHGMEGELDTFFQWIFGIDTADPNLDSIQFPTFEEVLGILDLAIARNETFKEYDLINIAVNSNRIGFLRQYLVLLMAQVIKETLIKSKNLHVSLIEKLKELDILKDTMFITTNYDILIDNALGTSYPGISIDYGIDFTNFRREDDWRKPDANSIKLYKVHGSLNWLYCQTCNEMTLTPYEKGAMRLIEDISNARCDYCDSLMVPIIVPPTLFKDFSNAFLSTIWNKAERDLRNVGHLIFCGYSFPDADLHIKYLIKRIETNRKLPLHITIINNHNDKPDDITLSERERFERFLATSVDYTNYSFEEFASDPMICWK